MLQEIESSSREGIPPNSTCFLSSHASLLAQSSKQEQIQSLVKLVQVSHAVPLRLFRFSPPSPSIRGGWNTSYNKQFQLFRNKQTNKQTIKMRTLSKSLLACSNEFSQTGLNRTAKNTPKSSQKKNLLSTRQSINQSITLTNRISFSSQSI